MLELKEDTFASEVVEAKGLVVVDFWAPWCGPCKMMGPVFEEAATEAGDLAKFAKLNVDEAQKTAAEFGVMSIPTLIIFKDGEKVDQMVGVQNKDTILSKLNALK